MTYFQHINNAVGREVTLRSVSDGEVSKFGDQINETTSDETVECVFEPEAREVEEGPEGDFNNKQIRAFFDSCESNVGEGNIIITDDNEYRIDEVQKYVLPGRGGHYEVRASLI